ncbi:hypothetical protein [Flavobacterium terrae]|uniref:Uncharacterized protein n=1 Tax=Flavobacterium terrae TaxID=415425 RepID=A0A1M6FZZ2_9FLAO|nr:hypothetical protein [Flavobacterium terrae]SHJ03311.1 hypothetical protein SAMN05444363_2441 [Flavobacterium terrae]
MGNFTNADLVYDDYSPTVDGGDNPKYIGVLDRKKVDKTEEYEVVYFCNQFLNKHKLTNKTSFQKVEKLLRDEEITDVDDREELIKWIEKNWNK